MTLEYFQNLLQITFIEVGEMRPIVTHYTLILRWTDLNLQELPMTLDQME